MSIPHIPVLRLGKTYESMSTLPVGDHRGGEPLAQIGQANAGLIRRDLKKIDDSYAVLAEHSCENLLDICANAGELYLNESLPLGLEGSTQSPQEYVETLSATSGLPHTLCRKNMAKVHQVFTEMPIILKGLTRGLDPKTIDKGFGEQAGLPVSFFSVTDSMGVVLPSNSPGVNSIWMPAIPLKIPVVLKPGREEPWTPYRIMQAFIAAGCPPESFCYYPTDHEGANTILNTCGRAILFGDEKTTSQYASNPAIQVHGPGWSKVLIGADQIDRWQELLPVLVDSVAANGGRSCINASAILTPKHGAEIADALANELSKWVPKPADDEYACLSAFANPKMAEFIDEAIEADLKTPGAEEVTAKYRQGPRKVEFEGSVFLHPTIVRCDSFEHPSANREFLFPYASVVEMSPDEMLEKMGYSLVVSAITEDERFIKKLLRCPHVDRLNLGPAPTSIVQWDQPHEGNLFEFLYHRRAIHRVA